MLVVKRELQRVFDANRNPDGTGNFAAVISSTGSAQLGSTQVSAENGVPHFETSFGSHYNEFVPADVGAEVESYMFSTRALCLPEAIVTADYIAEKFPTAKIALFRGDKTHDQMHTDIIRQRLAELGWQGTLLVSDDEAPVRWILAISASRRGVFTWKWRSRRAMAAAGNTRS